MHYADVHTFQYLKMIKDFNITLNTGENKVERQTPKINGMLLAVITKTTKPDHYHLKISLLDMSTITIFEEKEVKVQELFLPIKIDYYNYSKETFDADFVPLNDKLLIEVSGPKDLEVQIKLRYLT